MQVTKKHFHIPINGKAVLAHLKKNAVLCVALLAAFVTALFVPPDAE